MIGRFSSNREFRSIQFLLRSGPYFFQRSTRMFPSRSPLAPARFLFASLAVLILAGSSFATTEKMVYGFTGQPDGVSPNAALVADAVGNLYGTTAFGGTDPRCSCGTVFELSPPATAGGAWTENILYSFQGGDSDGTRPTGTLTFDAQGNLYGTTRSGGSSNRGTIFEISPPATAGGAWTETVLFVFPADLSKGYGPAGKLVFDAAGNLYGTTSSGGSKCDCGTVFELKAPTSAGGAWTHVVLHNFGPFLTGSDGIYPGPDIIYRNGVIYGVTDYGRGTSQNGTVFQLVRKPGTWTENILYRFTVSGGAGPLGGLVLDPAGNLYGTTSGGGSANCAPGCGTIYELSPPAVAGGAWQETILYSFLAHGDGAYPFATLWRNSLGDLYGTASRGGIRNNFNPAGAGTVFKLKAPASAGGAWTLAVLHDFDYPATGDGSFPTGALTMLNGVFS